MHDDERAFGAAVIAGVGYDQLWIGISSEGTRARALRFRAAGRVKRERAAIAAADQSSR